MGVYEVERVVARRIQRGKVEYFIKWKNYFPEENTWESHLAGSHYLNVMQHCWWGRNYELITTLAGSLKLDNSIPTGNLQRQILHLISEIRGLVAGKAKKIILLLVGIPRKFGRTILVFPHPLFFKIFPLKLSMSYKQSAEIATFEAKKKKYF